MDNLQAIIQSKGAERVQLEQLRTENFDNETIELKKHIIETYGKRVGKMISIMKMIRENDPELWKCIRYERFDKLHAYKNPDYFFTDYWAHHLGFFSDLSAIGNEAGGACGNLDFMVTENDCIFEMRGLTEARYINFWSRDCAKRFDDNFKQFEQRFKDFVNNHYGDGVYDL